MLVQQNGKVAVAALGSLLLGSGFGLVPVGRFVGARATEPQPPKPPIPYCTLPPPAFTGHPSRAITKTGPLTVEAMLSQSKLAAGTDGTVYVDVKITADNLQTNADDRRPIDFALVLDVSGSMAEANKIGLLKQACLDLQKQISPKDRVAVVAFSTDARTQFRLQETTPTSMNDYRRAIEELLPRGGTNISAGLELGAAELTRIVRDGAARRIILLTDGHPSPNLGTWTPEGLRGICAKLQQQGTSVSVVGLGLDYNSRLLSDMAEAGGGTYHYVDSAERIAGIYDAELRSLRSLVATGVNVTIEGVNGAELVDLIEWNGRRDGQKLTINAGDFESGRATKIVARLKARTWRDGCEKRGTGSFSDEVVRVALTGQASSPAAAESKRIAGLRADLVLGAEITTDAQLAQASVIREAQKDVEDAQVGDLLEKARARAESGDTAGARAFAEQLKQKRSTVTYKAGDGKLETMSVDQMMNAYESRDTEERARALHFSRSAASSAAK